MGRVSGSPGPAGSESSGSSSSRGEPQPSRGTQGPPQVRAPFDPSPRQPPAPPPRAARPGPAPGHRRCPPRWGGRLGRAGGLPARRDRPDSGRRQATRAGTHRPGAPRSGERLWRPPQGKWLGREDPGAAPKPGAPRPHRYPHPDPRRSPGAHGGRPGPERSRAAHLSPEPRSRLRHLGAGPRGQGGGSDREAGPGGDLGPLRDRRGRGSCAAQSRPTWWRAFGVT